MWVEILCWRQFTGGASPAQHVGEVTCAGTKWRSLQARARQRCWEQTPQRIGRRMSSPPYVRIVARGKGRGARMDHERGARAMTVVFCRGDAAPEAVGCPVMLCVLRGETPEENRRLSPLAFARAL